MPYEVAATWTFNMLRLRIAPESDAPVAFAIPQNEYGKYNFSIDRHFDDDDWWKIDEIKPVLKISMPVFIIKAYEGKQTLGLAVHKDGVPGALLAHARAIKGRLMEGKPNNLSQNWMTAQILDPKNDTVWYEGSNRLGTDFIPDTGVMNYRSLGVKQMGNMTVYAFDRKGVEAHHCGQELVRTTEAIMVREARQKGLNDVVIKMFAIESAISTHERHGYFQTRYTLTVHGPQGPDELRLMYKWMRGEHNQGELRDEWIADAKWLVSA